MIFKSETMTRGNLVSLAISAQLKASFPLISTSSSERLNPHHLDLQLFLLCSAAVGSRWSLLIWISKASLRPYRGSVSDIVIVTRRIIIIHWQRQERDGNKPIDRSIGQLKRSIASMDTWDGWDNERCGFISFRKTLLISSHSTLSVHFSCWTDGGEPYLVDCLEVKAVAAAD